MGQFHNFANKLSRQLHHWKLIICFWHQVNRLCRALWSLNSIIFEQNWSGQFSALTAVYPLHDTHFSSIIFSHASSLLCALLHSVKFPPNSALISTPILLHSQDMVGCATRCSRWSHDGCNGHYASVNTVVAGWPCLPSTMNVATWSGNMMIELLLRLRFRSGLA